MSRKNENNVGYAISIIIGVLFVITLIIGTYIKNNYLTDDVKCVAYNDK